MESYAMIYQYSMSAFCGALALYQILTTEKDCSVKNSIIVIMAWMVVCYGGVSLFQGFVEALFWLKHRREPIYRQRARPRYGDDIGPLAIMLLFYLLYANKTGECYALLSTLFDALGYAVWAFIVMLLVASVLSIFCLGFRHEHDEEDQSIEWGLLVYQLVIVIFYLTIAAIFIIIILIGGLQFSSDNDCEEKAPIIHFTAALLCFGGLTFVAFVGSLMTLYSFFPKYDEYWENAEVAHLN